MLNVTATLFLMFLVTLLAKADRMVDNDRNSIRLFLVMLSGIPVFGVIIFLLWKHVGWWVLATPIMLFTFGFIEVFITRRGRNIEFYISSYKILPYIIPPYAVALLILER